MVLRINRPRRADLVTWLVALMVGFGLGVLVAQIKEHGFGSMERSVGAAVPTAPSYDAVTIIAGRLRRVSSTEDGHTSIHVSAGSSDELDLVLDLSPAGTSVFVADLPRPIQSDQPLDALRQATGEGYSVQIARTTRSVISVLVVPPGFVTPTPALSILSTPASIPTAGTPRTPLPRADEQERSRR